MTTDKDKEIRRLKRQVKQLRDALQPLARLEMNYSDKPVWWACITKGCVFVSDVRKAADVMRKTR